MSKMQKTIMVPEELATLCDKIERRTGAPFTRIANTALLYLLATAGPRGPKFETWMTRYLDMERGETSFEDILARLADEGVK